MSSKLTVVSYNVRHARNIEGDVRLDHIASALRACLIRSDSTSDNGGDNAFGSSIICLQELDSRSPRSGWVRQARELAHLLGMKFVYYDSMSALGLFGFGNAIITNCAIHSTWNRGLPVKAGEPRKVMYLSVDLAQRAKKRSMRLTGGNKGKSTTRVHLFNTHWSLIPAERVKAAEICSMIVRKVGRYDPIIFCGDLNAKSHANEVRLLEESCGLTSVGFHRELPTFPSDSPKARIDHILVSTHFAIEGVRVVRTMASDHLPLVAHLRMSGMDAQPDVIEEEK